MNSGKDLQVRFPDFDFAAYLPFNLIEKKLFEGVGVVEERERENADRKKEDRHDTEDQCLEANGDSSFV